MHLTLEKKGKAKQRFASDGLSLKRLKLFFVCVWPDFGISAGKAQTLNKI